MQTHSIFFADSSLFGTTLADTFTRYESYGGENEEMYFVIPSEITMLSRLHSNFSPFQPQDLQLRFLDHRRFLRFLCLSRSPVGMSFD